MYLWIIFNYDFGLLRWDLVDWPETHCVAGLGLMIFLFSLLSAGILGANHHVQLSLTHFGM